MVDFNLANYGSITEFEALDYKLFDFSRMQGRKRGGEVVGVVHPQRHRLVGLKMRTIGLKIKITQLKVYTRCRAKIDNIS